MLGQWMILGFALCMLLAAWTDIAGYRIPNWIPGVLALSWPVAMLVLDVGWTSAGFSLLTGVIVLLIGMALWAPGWIGGGDAKLIAAAALWFGWPDTLVFMVYFAMAGGVLAIALLGMRKLVPALPLDSSWVAGTALADGAPAPYAVAIAAGALVALPSSQLFIATFG